MKGIGFSKYEGTGNDFVMIADLDDERPLAPAEVAALCHRRTGVGADGAIRVVRVAGDGASFRMDYANADGSPAEMCGNGIRCVAALLCDRELVAPGVDRVDVVTAAGVKRLDLDRDAEGGLRRAGVHMGAASFARATIPMHGPAWEPFLDQPFELGPGIEVRASAVSMGNPHLVLFVDEHPDRYHVGHIGPALERHELFPERTNVEFAHVTDEGIDVRVWERGSGETMACGSGACAVAVAAHESGRAPASVAIRFPGGTVQVERTEDDVILTGEARHVFDGSVDLERLAGRG